MLAICRVFLFAVMYLQPTYGDTMGHCEWRPALFIGRRYVDVIKLCGLSVPSLVVVCRS